jgi:uncharacterized pyridoxamine 5'-phosphate oxidase family protein
MAIRMKWKYNLDKTNKIWERTWENKEMFKIFIKNNDIIIYELEKEGITYTCCKEEYVINS